MNSDYSLRNLSPFSIERDALDKIQIREMWGLTRHHFESCEEYRRIVTSFHLRLDEDKPLENLPFLPIGLFKKHDLLSIDKSAVYKTLTSSGTTGDSVSKIYLDKENADSQIKTLSIIMKNMLGKKRLPMLIIDAQDTVRDRKWFSARTAAINGFSMFGKKLEFALDSKLDLITDTVEEFFSRNAGSPKIVFGFTSLLYFNFIQRLVSKGCNFIDEETVVLHGGGWKKMVDQSIDNRLLKVDIMKVLGTNRVHNYYGMVEQTGSIFIECEYGFFHCSSFSDIIVRDASLAATNRNTTGLVQVNSILPTSYPGHAILTQDLGEIVGIDDCDCGRMGKYFLIHGRAPEAELRGCSDIQRH